MGSGTWNPSTYEKNTGAKIRSGSTFGYSATQARVARESRKAHATLDPKYINSAGLNIRESRDSDEHPNSVPIAVFFDETGSMGSVPRTVQKKLTKLFGLLTGEKNYCTDPQIMVGAYGDADVDVVPLQVSQFESDNRTDDNLNNIFLEGNGGGNSGETVNLAWYYLANHTSTDSWEKRNKKGYAFFIADEIALPFKKHWVEKFIGESPQGELTNESIVDKMRETWEPFMLVIDNSAAKFQNSIEFYTKLFGAQNVLVVQDPQSIAETIAMAVGALEGSVDVETAREDLAATGSSELAIRSAVTAVTQLARGKGGKIVKNAQALDLSGKATDRF